MTEGNDTQEPKKTRSTVCEVRTFGENNRPTGSMTCTSPATARQWLKAEGKGVRYEIVKLIEEGGMAEETTRVLTPGPDTTPKQVVTADE